MSNEKSYALPTRRESLLAACGLFAGFLALYLLNFQFTPAGDATPNVYLALSLIDDGDMVISPREAPGLFYYNISWEDKAGVVRFDDWESVSPLGKSWNSLWESDQLQVERPEYYLVPTVNPRERGYASAFGLGSAMTAAPFYAVLQAVSGDLREQPKLLWFGSKVIASICTALSIVFIYLTLRRKLDLRYALAIATCYGVGTCLWSVSSQTLWQNGPNIMWLSLAVYCLFRMSDSPRWALGCGLACGMAVLCRSTSAIVVLAFAAQFMAWGYWRWRSWRAERADVQGESDNIPASGLARGWKIIEPTAWFAVAGLPLALLMFWHNSYCFGSPLASAHLASGGPLAQMTLGSADIWQTPLATGLSGLLFSPSRGLLIFSPILAVGIWGAAHCWFDDRWRMLRPLSAAALLIMLVTAKHFNWHGGWSFGYRAIVDIVPLLAVCGMAVAVDLWRRRPTRVLIGAALAWSIVVQVVGAYAYDFDGWNNRPGYLVFTSDQQPAGLLLERPKAEGIAAAIGGEVKPIQMNVDYAVHRRRLWSLSDNQIGYYLMHWQRARHHKEDLIAGRLRSRANSEEIVFSDEAP